MDYAEENDISKSEALRRSIRTGIQVEKSGLTRKEEERMKEEEKEAVSDGGTITRSILTEVASIWSVAGIWSFLFLAFAIPLPLAVPDNIQVGLILTGILSLLFAVMTFLTLQSDYPEKADRVLVSRISRIRGKVGI